jgi:PAS domain S-box-containing protein
MSALAVFKMTIAMLVSLYLAYFAVEMATREKLGAILEARYNAVSTRLEVTRQELSILAASPTTIRLLTLLTQTYSELGANAQTLLQQNYLQANNKTDSIPEANTELSSYNHALNLADPFFKRRHATYGWYDIFLIDARGNVVFTIDKEKDFATNLITGPWKDTGLANAVKPLLHDAVPGVLSFARFSFYAPSNNTPFAFVAMPVFDPEKKIFLGVVAIQLPVKQIYELMEDKTGLGKTGETVLLGKDGWMLTNSRFEQTTTILKKQLKTEEAQRVLSGETGLISALDYRGYPVYAAFKPLYPFVGGLGDQVTWGVIAKIDRSEVMTQFYVLLRMLLLCTAALIVFAMLAGYAVANSITRPILAIKTALVKLSRSEQTDIPCLSSTDELGEMARAAESLREMTRQVELAHWLSDNVTTLVNAVSAEAKISVAAGQVLHLLCKKLDVPVASIYLFEKDYYQRVGSHGLARRSQVQDSFSLNDGLVGQCAKDNQAVVISPVPAGLSIISSGLVEFQPAELVLYPIAHKNKVLAVIELATLHTITPRQHQLLKEASSALGLNLANLQAAEHNRELLEATRVQAEELRTSSAYARSLIEASLDPLVTIGINGKIMDVNAATEKVTGVQREQLIASDFCDYFTEPAKARAGYQQVFSQGFVTDYPLAISHTSGEVTDVLYNASVFRNTQGEVEGIFAAARDITDKKKAELKMLEQQQSLLQSNQEMTLMSEELRSQAEEMKAQNEELKANQEELRAQQEEMQQKNLVLEVQKIELNEVIKDAKTKSEQLRQANQYKSEFLANVSHELRTPLNSVLILSKNLAENEEQNLSAEQVESATVICESGKQLLTLINDILDLSKIEAGKLEIMKADFQLDDMLTYLRRIFTPQADKKQIEFSINVSPEIPKVIFTDNQRLTQILNNLVSNAIKFTDAGAVKLTVRNCDSSLQFEVIDTGIGIPADKIEHIFGAFHQMDGSTSRRYGGSGLGLAISRQLARLLGGELSVSSQPGIGSNFVVHLNNCLSSPDQTQRLESSQNIPRLSASPSFNKEKIILVVEDDSRLLALFGRMISGLGFVSICLESAEEALEYLQQNRPEGIFLDLGLPKINGMDLLRQLKADLQTQNIPVIIMSGAKDTGEAKKLGALEFLKKPITRETLIAAINRMLTTGQILKNRRVLLIDDNPVDSDVIIKLFIHDDLEIFSAKTGNEGLKQIETGNYDLVILDLKLPDMTGFEWLNIAVGKLNPPSVIIYSARELTEKEVFELKEYTESIITKNYLSERLREEVLLGLQKSIPQDLPRPTPLAVSTKKKLLLVDDDARNLYALGKALRARGYQVDVAPDATEALRLLERDNYDAVLTDIMMPVMDGYELIQKIRERGHASLMIIAITAKAMQGDDELCINAGANAYLAKPVDVDSLVALLNG